MMKLLFLCLFILLVGCVGTVENAKLPVNNLANDNKDILVFAGIEHARAVANDKIEIEFTPVGNASSDLKYHLFVNGNNATPIEIDSSSLDKAAGGRLRYLLKGLSINTPYKLRLRLYNTKTLQYSHDEKEFNITTFDSRTADFLGISSVSKVPGQTATQLKVTWLPAKVEGLIFMEDYDPHYYQVVYTDSSPAKLVDDNYSGPDKLVQNVPDLEIGELELSKENHPTYTYLKALKPNTTYYVMVRAVHKNYYNYLEKKVLPIPVDREVNTRFLTIKTDPETGIPDMNKDGLILKNAPGKYALSDINAFWLPASGMYEAYHVYTQKYSGTDDPTADDKLTTSAMVGMFNSVYDTNTLQVLKTDDLAAVVAGLDSYTWYQLKLVVCLDKGNCSPATENATNRIISSMKAIKTEPVLAQFSGITKIENPRNQEDLNNKSITLNWDKLSLDTGYADELEVYCVEPGTAFTSNPTFTKITDSGPAASVSGCENLTLAQELKKEEHISMKVNNVNVGQKYCFAMSPVINDSRHPVSKRRIPAANWVYRCITPEVKTPTIAQFSGINLSCNIQVDTGLDDIIAQFNWSKPSSGIFEEYVLFYKDLSLDSGAFRFTDAIATANVTGSAYQSTIVSSGTHVVKLPGLTPGNKYRFGMLTRATLGTKQYYSEYNVNIVECSIPLPTATFEEWTRIFAIGPKADGRVPLNTSREYQNTGLLLEALTQEGIPTELLSPSDAFFLPPGNYTATAPTSFGNEAFDGTHGKYLSTFVMASQTGIVSLAWKDVKLNFRNTTFKGEQNSGTRSNRKFGYKVYRSDNNRVTWKDLTSSRPDAGSPSGLLHAYPFNYRFLSNTSVKTDRMAFFTDYSASIERSVDTESTERGRIFWYKIVPVYNGKELAFDDPSLAPHHLIKVILPPANMALVHRKMANRTSCYEYGRKPDYANNYRCDYVGLGAVAKGFPWVVGETVMDQMGDLLVDRFELSCQYTRGDVDEKNSHESSSYFPFRPDGLGLSGFRSLLPEFDGHALDKGTFSSDTTRVFRGCAGRDVPQNSWDEDEYPDITINKYRNVVHGDCIGSGSLSMMGNFCDTGEYPQVFSTNFPGASERIFNNIYSPALDIFQPSRQCSSTSNADYPYFLSGTDPNTGTPGLLTEGFMKNVINQSEFMAVFHKRTQQTNSYTRRPPYKRPNGTITGDLSNCMINLASIDINGKWRARWLGLSQLKDHYTKTVQELPAATGIWGTGSDPSTDTHINPFDTIKFRNDRRYVATTPLARVMTSNAAKLPPITSLTPQTAEVLCNSLDIQVGYYDSSTDNWFPQTTKLRKQLLNRKEQVIAGAWPEVETYNSSYITSIEAGTIGGGCVGLSSPVGGPVSSQPGVSIDPKLAQDNGLGRSFYLTGSSNHDNPVRNSEKCVSKYGIQDIIGNVKEMTPHLLFCDYSKDHLYVGNENSPGTGFFLKKDAVLVPELDETFYIPVDVEFEDTTIPEGKIVPTADGFKAWESIDVTSGYCSLVDSNETRSSLAGRDNFVQLSEFVNLVKPDGSFNTSMVMRTNNVNQKSIDALRDGSGFYLNFGAFNLAPRLGPTDALAIKAGSTESTFGIGKYFNPYVGIPLACGASHFCDSGLAAEKLPHNDNSHITTEYLWSKKEPIEPQNEFKDFPTHNSQISHIGISEFTHESYSYTYDGTAAGLPQGGGPTILTNMKIDNGTTRKMTYTPVSLSSYLSGKPARTYKFVTSRFAIERETVLALTHGGSFSEGGNGRYAMGIQASSSLGLGFRCAVLIKDE